MKKLFSIQGMALLQVMIAAGILGGVGIGLTELMKSTSKSQKHSEQNQTVEELETRLLSLLSDPASCSRTLINQSVGSEISQIYLKKNDGSEEWQKDLSPGGQWGGIAIQKIRLSQLTAGAKDADGMLTLTLQRPSQGQRKSEVIEKQIPFSAQIDGSGKITSCFGRKTNNNLVEGACKELGGTYNHAQDRCEIDPLQIPIKTASGTASLQQALCDLEASDINVFGGKSRFCTPALNLSKCWWSGFHTPVYNHPAINCQAGVIVEKNKF